LDEFARLWKEFWCAAATNLRRWSRRTLARLGPQGLASTMEVEASWGVKARRGT